MKPNLTNIIVLLTGVLLVVSCMEDTKTHKTGMFLNSNSHSSNYRSISIKKSPKAIWKFKTEGQVISSPVIVGDVVYIGSNDSKLYALHKKTGKLIWEFKTDEKINSTPLVSQGKVMFLSFDGYFYAVDKDTGKLAWNFKTGGESTFKVKDYYNGSFKPDFWDFYLSSAIEKNGIVFFGSSDANVYALDIETGKKKWNYKTGGSIHSSPAISGNSLVVGSWDSKVYSLDVLTGKELWSYQTEKDLKQYIWLGIQASPSIRNNTVYVGSRDARMYAFNLISGEIIWTKNEFDKSWMPSSTAVDSVNIYTGSSDSFSFFSMNQKTGSINYATKTNAYTFSTPAIDNEMGYIGVTNGRLMGINLKTGIIKWEYKTEGAKTDSVKLFDAKGKMDVSRYKVLTKGIKDMPSLSKVYNNAFVSVGAILSSPAISERVLYFGSSDGYVYAISDK
jgi:outer membrane protein assembly factor BamB